MSLPDRVVAVHRALAAARIPHAFGGAIALAYCIGEPRATIDMDINVFLTPDRAEVAIDALPPEVEREADTLDVIARDGQVRLWWEHTPIDLFFNTTDFHDRAALRARHDTFGPVELPILACRDLAVFKAFFDRGRDWVDLEAMADAGALDVSAVAGVLVEYLGPDDPRVARMLTFTRDRTLDGPGRPGA